MEEKDITPETLVEYFEKNPDMIYVMTWASNLTAHYRGIGMGCKCKHQQKIRNLKGVYENVVLKIIANNPHFIAIFKKEYGVQKLIFKIEEEILLEV